MTSKISFSKLTLDELRKFTWLFAIQFLGFGMLMPIRVLIALASHASDLKKWELDWTFTDVFCKNTGLGISQNTFMILAAGIFCAMCIFGYVHSSVKLDFWHSLPITRERLFAVKYLAGTLTFVLAYVLNQILAVLAGAAYGAVNARIVFEMGTATVQGILVFLCSFSGTLTALMLTGKMLTTVFAVTVMAGYIPVLYILAKMLESVFLPNLLDSGHLAGTDWIGYTSPWMFSYSIAQNGETSESVLTGPGGPMPGAAELCQLVAMAAICTAVALLLYRTRRSEAAGSALAFAKTEGVIKLLLSIPGAIGAAVIAYELSENIIVTAIFLVLAGLIFCMIMEFIYRWDIQQIIKKKHHMLITLAAGIAVFGMYYFDVAGINTYLPEKTEIETMAVCDDSNRYNCILHAGFSEYYAIKEGLTYQETEKIDQLYEVAKSGIENSGKYLTNEDTIYVYMKFRLKNGKEIYRNYHVNAEQYMDTMDEFMKDEDFRARYFSIASWKKEDMKNMDGSCWLPVKTIRDILGSEAEELSEEYENTAIEIKASQLWQVIEAYQKDLKNISYRDYLFAEGNMYFNIQESNYYYNMGNYGVGEKFTETMKVLQEIWPENMPYYGLG